MSPFGAFLLGAVLVVAGLAFGAYLLNVPAAWVGAAVLGVAAVGVVLAANRTRPPGRL